MRSMTGFGQVTGEASGLQVSVTLQGVNHRYLDIVLRMPEEIRFLEAAIRERLNGAIRRGRCEAAVSLRRPLTSELEVELQTGAVRKLLAACRPLVESGELSPQLTIGDLARSPTFLRVERSTATWSGDDEAAIWRTLDSALAQFEHSRSAEGERIGRAIDLILGRLLEVAAALRERLPEARALIAESVRQRLRDWTAEYGVEEDRLLSEIAVLAEKSDVQEEMDRLAAHLEQLQEVMLRPSPIGRHLDFLAQELLRELNTLCAKCRDTRVVQLGLDARLLCEQIREQVQNVE
ncbi:MAG: YicC/YloC family endoribonuclease [Thermoanaerobaculia bacterium]